MKLIFVFRNTADTKYVILIRRFISGRGTIRKRVDTMGVFDFVKNAGAKVGIGKSTGEEAAEKAEAEAQAAERAEASAKMAKIRREARAKTKANKETADTAKAEATSRAIKRNAEAKLRKAAHNERVANYSKSSELEKYVTDMGIDIGDADIRFDDGIAYITGEVADQATRERIILAVGNAQGVGKVDEEITVVDPSEEAHFHTVAPGDTLWAVAEKVYGDGSRYTEIFEANKPMLSNPDLIFPGQVLRCPMDD